MKMKISALFLLAMFAVSQSSLCAQDAPESAMPTQTLKSTAEMASEKFVPGVEQMISVDFNEADIKTVLEVMALKGGVNIVAGPDVAGAVTLHLKDVSWQSAFETLIRTYGFVYDQNGNIFEVFSPESGQNKLLEEVRSEVITLQYATLDQVKKALDETVSSTGKIETIQNTNQIVITDTSSALRKARNVIAEIDQKNVQVLIDAKIIRTALGKGEELGIDWNLEARARGARRPTTFPFSANPARIDAWDQGLKQSYVYPRGQTQVLNTTTATATGATGTSQTVDFPQGAEAGFPFAKEGDFSFGTLDFSQLTAVIKFLKTRKNSKIISNPRIVVLNHEQASVKVGGEIGIPTFERNETTGSLEVSGFAPRDVGVTLNVVPHVTAKKEIIVKVKPEITSFDGTEPLSADVFAPKFSSIVADTNVLVHSGDTIVIAGMITNREDDQTNKIPYLNKIPMIGWAFKSIRRDPQQNQKDETIFFVTVSLADDVYNQEALKKWEQSQKEYEDFRKFSEEEIFNKKKDKEKKKTENKDEEKTDENN